MEKQRKLNSQDLVTLVRDFLGGPIHICPFGRHAARQCKLLYKVVSAPDYSWIKALSNFLKSSDMEGLVLILPRSSTTLELAERKTDEYFLSLVDCLARLEFSREPDVFREEILNFFRKYMHDPNMHIFPSYEEDRIHFTYMGPEYLPNGQGIVHPRYAPHPIFVIVRESDVDRVRNSNPRIVNAIREAMITSVGSVYDADARFLGQCPIAGKKASQ